MFSWPRRQAGSTGCIALPEGGAQAVPCDEQALRRLAAAEAQQHSGDVVGVCEWGGEHRVAARSWRNPSAGWASPAGAIFHGSSSWTDPVQPHPRAYQEPGLHEAHKSSTRNVQSCKIHATAAHRHANSDQAVAPLTRVWRGGEGGKLVEEAAVDLHPRQHGRQVARAKVVCNGHKPGMGWQQHCQDYHHPWSTPLAVHCPPRNARPEPTGQGWVTLSNKAVPFKRIQPGRSQPGGSPEKKVMASCSQSILSSLPSHTTIPVRLLAFQATMASAPLAACRREAGRPCKRALPVSTPSFAVAAGCGLDILAAVLLAGGRSAHIRAAQAGSSHRWLLAPCGALQRPCPCLGPLPRWPGVASIIPRPCPAPPPPHPPPQKTHRQVLLGPSRVKGKTSSGYRVPRPAQNDRIL